MEAPAEQTGVAEAAVEPPATDGLESAVEPSLDVDDGAAASEPKESVA